MIRMNYEHDMLRLFPSILPIDGVKLWEGFINSKGNRLEHHFISVKTPNFPDAEGIELSCSHSLQKLISPHMESVKKCKTAVDFLHSISQIMNTKLNMVLNEKSKKLSKQDINLIGYISEHIKQEHYSQNIIEDMDPTSGNVKLKYTDATGYTHFMVILVKYKYPNSSIKVLEADLPEEVIKTFPQAGTLTELYDSFVNSIDLLVPFWILMDNLADKMWVVEPEIVKKCHIHRRILINDNLSIVLTFNPMKAHEFPDVQFLGSLQAVVSARTKYQQNLQAHGWDEELTVIANLMKLCQLDGFLVKPTTNGASEDTGKECFICFADLVDGQPPPSKWCSNDKCSSYYHLPCLLEWLTTVPTSTIMMDFISGPCPYCNEVGFIIYFESWNL